MWAHCTEGHHHWGTRGAAGLLLADAGRVLLQLRSASVQLGGTWSVPGGAIEARETPTQAALREAAEETGLDPSAVVVTGRHVAHCGGWCYVTIVGSLARPVSLRGNGESARLSWVEVPQVRRLRLHPAFATAWAGGLAEAVAQ